MWHSEQRSALPLPYSEQPLVTATAQDWDLETERVTVRVTVGLEQQKVPA